MSITSVGTPLVASNTTGPLITSTWGTGQSRSAGNLLCALVIGGFSGGNTGGGTILFSGTGWVKSLEALQTDTMSALWTVTARGSDAAPVFSANGTGVHQAMAVILFELNDPAGSTPVIDTSGTATATSVPLSVTTSGNVTASGEYALGAEVMGNTIVTSTNTWGSLGSWTDVADDTSSSKFWHWIFASQASPSSGSTLNYNFSSTAAGPPNAAAGLIAVIKPGIPAAPAPSNPYTTLIAPGLIAPSAWAGPHISSRAVPPEATRDRQYVPPPDPTSIDRLYLAAPGITNPTGFMGAQTALVKHQHPHPHHVDNLPVNDSDASHPGTDAGEQIGVDDAVGFP